MTEVAHSQHQHTAERGHAGHGDHVAQFRRLFWIMLVLAVPTVALSGTGTEVKLEPLGVNFGDQKVGTKSSPIGIELTNLGTTTLSISGITMMGKDPGDFSQTNNCGNSVPAGGHCTIKVSFVPQVRGARSATLTVTDDGGGSPQTVALAGTGT